MVHQPTQFKFSPLVGITGLKVAVEAFVGVAIVVVMLVVDLDDVVLVVVAKVVVMLVVELDDVVLVVVTTFVALQEASPVLEIFEANNGNVTVCVSEVKSVYFSSTVKDFPRGLPP